jgi:glutathione synthase/RimK-type ligase-like ATP-grasp enzyme
MAGHDALNNRELPVCPGDSREKTLVLLITDFRGLIPQRIMAWDGYDLDTLKRKIESSGVEVQIVGAHQIDFVSLRKWSHVAALYASSQDPHYKQYLQDIVVMLHSSGVTLFPLFEHMMAHEDKAFQALRLSTTDISSPRSLVFGNKKHAYQFLAGASYPLVGKSVAGFGSRGVQLIRDVREGERFVDTQMSHRVLEKGRSLHRRFLQRIFKPKPVLGILLFQELIPNLEGDWKILIWGDVACGIFRENRKNDFRASGGGRNHFIDIPHHVLDFARGVLDKLELPWGSLDIGYDGRDCYLIEYQGLHFGLTTAEKGLFYFVRNADAVWEKKMGRIQIETEMAKIIRNSLAEQGMI